MKRIYLTFDIETLVSRRSYNPSIYTNIFLGTTYLAKELKKRNLKATFFISLSPKTDDVNFYEYLEVISLLIDFLSHFPNLKIQPHLHAKNIPVDFDTSNDSFSKYNLQQQVKLLLWAENFFNSHNIHIDSFRPGGYNRNEYYYKALAESGYKYSSLMESDKVQINTITNRLSIRGYHEAGFGIVEYPVTSVRIKSIKGREETLNLSPDFFTLESVKVHLEKLDYININFHSFSVFCNRFSRENHKKNLTNNITYLFFERPVIKILKKANFEMINHETLFRKELLRWLDFIAESHSSTFLIGE